jgi:hypothetical protein
MSKHVEYMRIDREGAALVCVDVIADQKTFTRRKPGEAVASLYAPPALEQRIADQVLQEARKPDGIIRLFFESTDFDIDWRR